MKKSTFLTLAFLMLLGSARLYAGWIITEKTTDPYGETGSQTLMFQDQKIRLSDANTGFIFDLKTGKLTMVDDAEKIYWTGKIDSFREESSKAMKTIVENMISKIPKEQQAMFRQIFENMENMYREPDPGEINAMDITIEKTGETEKIAGYSSTEFIVSVNGKKVEQVWLSSQLDISGEFDLKAFQRSINQITPASDQSDLYQYNDRYIDLIGKGYPMKTIDADGTTTEVTSIKETGIPHSEFEPDPQYKRIDLTEMMKGMMNEENDDNPNH